MVAACHFGKMRSEMNRALPVVMVLSLWIFSSCEPSGDGSYFPISDSGREVTSTRVQEFIVDTLLTELNRPWDMEFLPDGEVLITERSGRLLLVQNGVLQGAVNPVIEPGFRGIRMHPEFESNRQLYLSYYKEDPSLGEGYHSILTRGRFENDQLLEEEVIYSTGPFSESPEWYGNRIEFDPDGYLYFAVGQRDGVGTTQDLMHPSGKTMRLFDDGQIPADNPFMTQEALPEIYTYGHRQHQGLTRHPETGEIWSNEHGAKGGDEVNILAPGANFGWPLATYSLNYDDTIISPDTLLEGTVPPVHHWTPSIAPSGLAFSLGETYPGWEGDMFTGSLKFRYLMRSRLEGNSVKDEEILLENIGRVRTVKTGPDNYLYLLTEDTGLLIRLLPASIFR